MDFFRVFHHTPAAPAVQQESRPPARVQQERELSPAAKAAANVKNSVAPIDLMGFFLFSDPVGL